MDRGFEKEKWNLVAKTMNARGPTMEYSGHTLKRHYERLEKAGTVLLTNPEAALDLDAADEDE